MLHSPFVGLNYFLFVWSGACGWDSKFTRQYSLHELLCSYLGHEHETQCGGRTKDNENGDDHERGILLVAKHKRQADADDAHDDDIVDTHADVLRVVQRRNRDVPRLPGQEDAEYLPGAN